MRVGPVILDGVADGVVLRRGAGAPSVDTSLVRGVLLDVCRRMPFKAGRETPGPVTTIWCRRVLCFLFVVLPWPEPNAIEGGVSGISIVKVAFAGLDRGGVLRAGRRGDGKWRLLLGSDGGHHWRRLRSDARSSSGRWSEGGGSNELDPGCDEHGEVPRSMCYRDSIGFAFGGPPMRLSKPGWATVLHRVHRRCAAKQASAV